jgi:N-acylneuraminate cytidylyltransferase
MFVERKRAFRDLHRLKVVGFIPARGGSRGIKNKNLKVVAGYSLVARAIMTLYVAGVKPIYVSTDSSKIKKEAIIYGAEVIDRPDELAMNDSPTEDAIEHFLSKVKCDVVVMVQVTSPLLSTRIIFRGLSKLVLGNYDSIFSTVPAKDILLWRKPWTPINYRLENRGTRQNRRTTVYIETGALYIFRVKMFNKTKCRLGGNIGVIEVPFWNSFQVDNGTDLNNIKKLVRK